MKKKFLKIILILVLLLFIISIFIYMYLAKKDEKICLKEEYKEIEYGESYDPDVESLIDINKFNFIDVSKIVIESNIKNENEKNYPAVGKYEVKVFYKNIELTQEVNIVDTISPKISIEELKLDYDTDLSTLNLKEHIKVSDLSELKDYVVDVSKVNSKISGEYEIPISVEDIYNNASEENMKITILEKKEEIIEEQETVIAKQENSNKSNEVKDTKKKVTNTKTSKNITNQKDSNNTEKVANSKNTNTSKVNNTNENKEEAKEKTKCNHSNENYYNTQEEAVATYEAMRDELSDKVKSGEIETYEEYVKKTPYGYETWTCVACGKWTIRFYYQ